MSNAFASSLWAGDYLLTLATEGCGGVNLHGGDSRFLSASLGNHNPGLEVAGHQNAPAPNGFYTPIATEQGQIAEARPVYYGMLLAQEFAGATMQSLEPAQSGMLGTYAAVKNGRTIIALVNKASSGDREVIVTADKPFHEADRWGLIGPALDATAGVEFGGAFVSTEGSWSPRSERLPIRNGALHVAVPAASGALIFLS